MLVWMCLESVIFFGRLAFLATFATFLFTKMEDGADCDLTKRDLAAPFPKVRWRDMGVSRLVEGGSFELVKSIVAMVDSGVFDKE